MTLTNSPPALSDEAFDMLLRLLQGGVAVFKAPVRSCTSENLDDDSETGDILSLRSGLVSVGRTIFGIETFRELEAHDLITEDGDLTETSRLWEAMASATPEERRALVGGTRQEAD